MLTYKNVEDNKSMIVTFCWSYFQNKSHVTGGGVASVSLRDGADKRLRLMMSEGSEVSGFHVDRVNGEPGVDLRGMTPGV